MLNDESVAVFLGLVPAHLPQPHSLQCMHACAATAVTAVDANFRY